MAHRVLLVDDEPWALRDMEMTFPWEKYDFRVGGSFRRAEDALDALIAMRPDVVVTDLRMPGLSGVDLLRQARERGSESIFVLVSGVSDFEAARLAIRYGAVEYCLKPLEETHCEQLVQRIAALLAKKAGIETPVSHKMREILDFIDANLHRKMTLASVAGNFHISANTLTRMFRAEMNTTFGQHLEERRLEFARRLLRHKHLSIREVAERTGYSDQNYFAVCFKRRFSMTPMQYHHAWEDGERP